MREGDNGLPFSLFDLLSENVHSHLSNPSFCIHMLSSSLFLAYHIHIVYGHAGTHTPETYPIPHSLL